MISYFLGEELEEESEEEVEEELEEVLNDRCIGLLHFPDMLQRGPYLQKQKGVGN